MDYIKFTDTGETVKLTSVRIIEPTIWKGYREGVLYLKDGSTYAIKISSYGNFFVIKGETHGLFSSGKIYQYNG